MISQVIYQLLVVGDHCDLPQWRVTDDIGKRHHLCWSYKSQLKWFAIQVVGDHVGVGLFGGSTLDYL